MYSMVYTVQAIPAVSQCAELGIISTVKPLIKDTPKEDKPPNKGQVISTRVYTLYRKSLLKEDNLSTKRTNRLVPIENHF